MYLVSGRKYAKNAMHIAGTPRTNIGRGFQAQASFDIKGAEIPNILDMVEQDPIAWLLKFVGYNSPVMR